MVIWQMRDLKGQDYLGLFKKSVIYLVMAMIAIVIVAIVYTMGVMITDYQPTLISSSPTRRTSCRSSASSCWRS